MLWYQTIQLISSQFLFYRMKRNKIFFLFQILGLDNTYVNIFFRHKNISQPWDTINTWKIIIQIFRARGKETPADRIKWTNYKKNAPIYEATAAKNSPTSTLPPFRSCKFNVRRADDAFIFYLALVQRGQPVKHSTISTSARHELATSSPYLLRAGLTVASFSSPIFTIHIAYPIPSKNRLFLSQIFQVETLPLSVLSCLSCFYFYSSCIRSYGVCKMVSFYE